MIFFVLKKDDTSILVTSCHLPLVDGWKERIYFRKIWVTSKSLFIKQKIYLKKYKRMEVLYVYLVKCKYISAKISLEKYFFIFGNKYQFKFKIYLLI